MILRPDPTFAPRYPRLLFIALLLLVLIPGKALRAGEFDAEQFRRDLQVIGGQPNRAVGTQGYEAAMAYVEAEIRKLEGVELQVHTFDLMTPQTESATLTTDAGTSPIYPVFPAGVRMSTTPAEGIRGELVYCGVGEYAQIPAARVKGNIAVVEATISDEWKTVAYFGPRAILLLGRPDVTQQRLKSQETIIPINMPRFYVPEGPLADALRAEKVGRGTVKASGNWKRTIARNLYAYVAPKDPLPPVPDRGVNGKPWAALTFVVPVDATALVPDASPAAGQAVQPAAALAMLRDYAKNPPRRPVLFAFTGADSYNLLGSRHMMMALADPPLKWRNIMKENVDPLIAGVEADLKRARELNGDVSKLDIVKDRSLIGRIVKIVETDVALEQDQLFRLRVLPKDQLDAEKLNRISELEKRQIRLNQIKYAFTSAPRELAQFGDDAPKYLQRVLVRLGGTAETTADATPDDEKREGLSQQLAYRKSQLQRRIELYEWLADRINAHASGGKVRDKNPGLRDNSQRLLECVIGLDFTDGGVRVGPIFWGRLWSTSSISQVQSYKEWFEKKSRSEAWFKPLAPLIDLEPFKLTRTLQSFLGAPVGYSTETGLAWGIPAFTFATLDDMRPRRDTPVDTLDRLDLKVIVPQATALHTLLRQAADDGDFFNAMEYRRNNNQYGGQVVSLATGRPIPDLPREGFLATYFYLQTNRKIPAIRGLAYAAGIRRSEVRDCDAEGHYFFEGLPKVHTDIKQLLTKVYRIAPDSGEINASTDLGKQAADMKIVANLDQDVIPLKSVVFDCEEFSLFGLYDPRFLQGLGEVQLMDARRNAEPQRFDCVLLNQMMAAQFEPGSRSYLLFRYGRIGNRIVMLNMPETQDAKARAGVRGEGEGYTIRQLLDLGPLALATARDFLYLNGSRISEYAKAGVTSALIDKMHADAQEQLDAARAAYKADNTPEMMRNATGAWADQARVYDAVNKMVNDVIYAAIFLLLLAVPFSFCMERLLVGTPNIYKQIAYTALIFAVMALALWLFHPAFKISSSPLIIILAFAIILMSIVVISVVYSKFDTELKRIRSGRGTAEGASFAKASVLMSAVMLGIANMRRRKFRTALTAITVVLITFAVLCFTSASRYQSTISLPTGVDSQYAGLLLRQRGFRAMPREALDSLRAAYPDLKFVERWWNINAWDPKDQVHLVAGGVPVDGKAPRVVPLQAMLGLSPGESEISPIEDIIPHFDRLEKGEQDIIFLPLNIAEQLGVKEGDTIHVAGRPLEVAGLYDPSAFDQRMTILSGEGLAPLKYTSGALDASGKRLTDANSDTLDLDADAAGAEASASYEHLPATEFAIVPASVSRQLEYASLRTIGVKVADESLKPQERDEAVQKVVDDVVKRFALATFAGYSDGVKLVSASNLASIGGGANVAIPLAIGGLIIFNTMMGSIAERKREIHVYTSLGLAPLHVGALFVAEAMTYGLIGSVFGYIIGQGVGTLLLKLGWLGNVTLNYSGTSAMLTLGLILLIVLLSALVPARLASKIAAPSIERSWRVPAPQGDQIIAQLPFTINKTAAEGVVAYLAEFFEAHQEGSIGKFSAGKIEAFAGTGDDGKPTRGLKTVVWLTPFDLGVRQHLLLLIHQGDVPDIYEVQVILERLSGDDGSWWRMNRSFLTELRKQFLQWRSLSPQRMKDYVIESRKLFQQIPDSVVTTDTTEEVRLG